VVSRKKNGAAVNELLAANPHQAKTIKPGLRKIGAKPGIDKTVATVPAATGKTDDGITVTDPLNFGETAVATAKRVDVEKAAASAGRPGPSIPLQGNNPVKAMIAATHPVTTGVSRPAEFSDQPAEEMTGAEGNDAVSIIHLAKSKGSVRKLFRRLAGGSNNPEQADLASDKKVNISIFQFALGK